MDFETLKTQLPTREWRIEMEEQLNDEDLSLSEVKFNEEILNKVDVILNNYISSLQSLDKSQLTEDTIKLEVKKVVIALNEFDKKKPFIDTGQREDLCNFIEKGILATGYKLNGETDYTLEWREW